MAMQMKINNDGNAEKPWCKIATFHIRKLYRMSQNKAIDKNTNSDL